MVGAVIRGWVLLAVLLLPGVSDAEPAACGPFTVGLRLYPRLYQREANGDYQGLDKDFFEALAQRSGCQFELKVDSQPRIWHGLRNGSIDLASWVIQTEDRSATVYVIPLLQSRPMAVTWRESPAQTQAEFMADANLSAIKIRQSVYGPGYDELFEKLREQNRLSEVADFDTALKVFTTRHMGLIVAYPWTLLGQSEQWMAQVRFSDWHPGASTTLSGLAISRRSVSPPEAQRLEDAVRAMQRDGSLAQMVARHLPTELAKLVPPPR